MYHDTLNPAFVALEKIIFECPAFLYEYQKSFIPDFVDCFLKYFDDMSDDQLNNSIEDMPDMPQLDGGILNKVNDNMTVQESNKSIIENTQEYCTLDVNKQFKLRGFCKNTKFDIRFKMSVTPDNETGSLYFIGQFDKKSTKNTYQFASLVD